MFRWKRNRQPPHVTLRPMRTVEGWRDNWRREKVSGVVGRHSFGCTPCVNSHRKHFAGPDSQSCSAKTGLNSTREELRTLQSSNILTCNRWAPMRTQPHNRTATRAHARHCCDACEESQSVHPPSPRGSRHGAHSTLHFHTGGRGRKGIGMNRNSTSWARGNACMQTAAVAEGAHTGHRCK